MEAVCSSRVFTPCDQHTHTHTHIHCPQEIVRVMAPQIIAPDHAVRLRAQQDLIDKDGSPRAIGEEWLVRDIGAYLPGVFEEVGQPVVAWEQD